MSNQNRLRKLAGLPASTITEDLNTPPQLDSNQVNQVVAIIANALNPVLSQIAQAAGGQNAANAVHLVVNRHSLELFQQLNAISGQQSQASADPNPM